ncbi:MAG: prepilin-type N-terminal cleavage/methylation domain-containing protein [Candidatus Azotimanducaceae bacterium]|jgi:prepilin-type N-terminal cleavage/methylation domain-containing protein
MQMLASFPNSRGFTLLELLVVMGLVSLITAVAMPGVVSMYDSVSRNLELEGIAADINQLGRIAYESGASSTLSPKSFDLPDGWRFETTAPITYSAQGVCRGGTLVLLKNDEFVRRFKLAAPYCQTVRDS